MTPKIAGTGTSFKGAAMYYLHDKRKAGEMTRLTSERVAWTATRNLATDDPELAVRIMAATAKNQATLKAAAGIKNTGRQSAQHVYSYSLAWHPDETGSLTRADMLKAADETLHALGAADYQAVIVAHRDTAHPHVHVLVNRVSAVDGRLLPTSNDRRILSAWALKHERERGQVYCIERERKAERRPSPAPDFTHAANDKTASAAAFRQRAAELAKASEQMRARHSQQWAALSAGYKVRKDAIYGAAGRAIGDAIEESKARYKPAWREHFRNRDSQTKAFERGERSIGGVINNAIQSMSARKRAGIYDRHGLLGTAFNFMTNKAARLEVLTAIQDKAKAALSARQKADLDAAITVLKDGRGVDLKTARSEFDASRAELIARQAKEKDEQRVSWRKLNDERRRAGVPAGRYGAGRHDDRMGASQKPAQARNVRRGNGAAKDVQATQRARMAQESTKSAESIPKRDWRKAIETNKAARSRNRGRSRTRRREPD